MTESRRFLIETLLPLRKLSEEARREKAIRHGHIFALHVWRARRPLVVARASVLGVLLTESTEVDEKFIANRRFKLLKVQQFLDLGEGLLVLRPAFRASPFPAAGSHMVHPLGR